MKKKQPSKNIQSRLEPELNALVDAYAEKHHMNRSQVNKLALWAFLKPLGGRVNG